MKKRKSKIWGFTRRVLPYLVFFVMILTVMIVGSRDEQKVITASIVLNVINDRNFVVTTDQLSESFIVADTARTFSLPSANSISENFVSIAIQYAVTGGQDTGVPNKPNIIDTSNLARGILTYTVQQGDTLQAIALRFGLTTTQIRWSNNMKNETIAVGQTLFLPSVPGILYTVKSDDTLEAIAERYQSDAIQVRALNDLEISGLVAGKTIILPNGILPDRERPEYVPPTPRPPWNTSVVLVDSGVRHDMREIGSSSYWRSVTSSVRGDGNPSTAGQCTWFSWWWRRYNMPENYWLPSSVIGNARDWVRTLSGGYVVNQWPAYGAVAQTRTSGFGHVGIVTGVVEGEYIILQEMNYLGPYRVNEARVNWSDALRWYYIHGRR
jgi:surface antigen